VRRTSAAKPAWRWPLLLFTLAASSCAGVRLGEGSSTPQFDCASARLAHEPGGYRLEGCGQIAFFHCSVVRAGERQRVKPLPTVYWTPQSTPEAGQFRATREGVDQSTTSGDCVLSSQRAMSVAERDAALARLTPSAAVDATTHAADAAQVRARVRFQGGQLELLSPSNGPFEHLLLSLHGKQPLHVDNKCRMSSFVDGTWLTIEAVRQRSAHEVQLVVPARELHGLSGSTRFFGSVCGLRFDLDERARRDLAKFELALR